MKPTNDLERQVNEKSRNVELSSETPVARPGSKAYFKTFVAVAVTYWLLSSVIEASLDRFAAYRSHVVVPDQATLESALWALGLPKGSDWDEKFAKTEQLFLSIPDAKRALTTSRAYATHPHLAGSPEDLDDAKVILELFQDQFGITPPSDLPLYDAGSPSSRSATLDISKLPKPTAWIDKYFPVMNTGVSASLSILAEDGEEEWVADLLEDGDPADPEAGKYRTAIPTWHGLSGDGDVQGQLVYVNYGRKEDFDRLVAQGVDFKGKIVIARYFAVFRGLKIKAAEELGAAGVLIYSDPRDDGVVTVENGFLPYPAGPARNPSSVQRGSVQYISLYPGDPTTPGYPAYENATRTDGDNKPKIPSLPVSWANAQRLLKELDVEGDARVLNGKVSEKKVRLVNRVNERIMPIWNTMAVIPGHIKNESVLLGCHRDAWVMGAADPTSGTVTLTEVVYGLGALLKSGWRPLRNIVIASWDAEEYGLIGSTEWGEDFAEWIQENIVAYINIDVSVSGSQWNAGGSPSLAHLIQKTAQDVTHPTDPNRTLWDARLDEGPFSGAVDSEFMEIYESMQQKKATVTGITPLGSGSDYTVFLQRLGVASTDQGFGFTFNDAVYHYHSIYDSQHWQEVYADPTFERHTAVSKHLGLMTLRFADSIILPLNTTQYALELEDYLHEVENLSGSSIQFSKLRKSIKRLQRASHKLDVEKAEAEEHFKKLLNKLPGQKDNETCEGPLECLIEWLKKMIGLGNRIIPIKEFIKAAKRVQTANEKLALFEQGFISEGGIKDREWYKHLGVAPGKWLGYGATTLPGLSEAIEFEKNDTLASYEEDRLVYLLDILSDTIRP